MLTTVMAFEFSGNTSNCKPLARRYSVMPSELVMSCIPSGKRTMLVAGKALEVDPEPVEVAGLA
jgi:hypothetical protein